MRKLFFCLAFVLAFGGEAVAHEFNVSRHGTLEQLVTERMSDPNLPDDQLTLTELIVTGEIDGKDLAYIHNATGLMQNVQKIDLSGVTIIPTNDYYAKVEYNPMSLYYPDYKYLYFDDNYSQTTGGFMTGGNVQTNYHIHSNDLAFMFKGMTKLREVKLPDQVKAYGESIFEGCTNLESVTAPSASMSVIPTRAFYNCKKLNMAISGEVTSVGSYAFYECTGMTGNLVLTDVTEIPERAFYNTSFSSITINSPYLESIGLNAFGQKSKKATLTSLDLSGATNLKSIGTYAFAENSGLDMPTVKFPEGLTSIEEGAFSGCKASTSYTIPESVIHLGKSALAYYRTKYENGFSMMGNILYYSYFDKPDNVTELNIPEGVTIITDDALGGINTCKNVESVTLPEGLRSIGRWSFHQNSKLGSISIPSTVEYIGYGAFAGCSSLTSVKLPASLKVIGQSAFSGCTGIGAITIPEKVEDIQRDAFEKCTGLWRVTYNAQNATNSAKSYIFTGCSGITQFNWGENIKRIPTGLCYKLTCVTSIPQTTEVVEDWAFQGCTGITSLPASTIKYVGTSAFYQCTGLTSVTLSDDATYIGKNAFYQCSNLATIGLGNSLQFIGEEAFRGCAISSITLPSTIKSIDKNALSCSSLTSVYIDDLSTWCGIKLGGQIGSFNLYAGGQQVTDVVIPEGTTEIGNYAFCGVKGITSVSIPSTLKKIGASAFYGVSCAVNITDLASWCGITFMDEESNPANSLKIGDETLTDIVIPDGVTEIKSMAFQRNGSLKTVVLPNSVESIGSYAFANSALNNIDLGNGVKTIGTYALNSTQITNLTLPSTLQEIGYRACFDGNLAYVIAEGDVPPAGIKGAFITYKSYSNSPNPPILYAPVNALPAYSSAYNNEWCDSSGNPLLLGYSQVLPEAANSFCCAYDGEFSDDTKVYTFSHIKDGMVYGELVEDNTVVAGKPYLLVPEAGATRIAFQPNNTSAEPLTAGLADDNGAMQGVLADDCDEGESYKTVTGSDYIVFTTKGLRLANSASGTKIKAGKCYINKANAFQATTGNRVKAIATYQGDEPVSINSVDADAVKAGQGYSLNGTKSDGKGIVVYKGRKVLR